MGQWLNAERLSQRKSLPINSHRHQPSADTFIITYNRVLKLCMAVRAKEKEICRVVTYVRVEVVNLKERLTIRFPECERAYLALAFMQFTKEDADAGWDMSTSLRS